MLTMQKEKVNTHFSFPLKLDMSGYVEKTLLPQQYHESKTGVSSEQKMQQLQLEEIASAGLSSKSDVIMQTRNLNDDDPDAQYEYNLIGVTVHTGNADGGHYYSFIKERNGLHPFAQDRWFLFNDAEVKQFDPSQIEAECFGGEMTSKTYDTVTEKYLDFSFEKTNSAYMLFYERCDKPFQSDHDIQIDQNCSDDTQTNDDSFEQQASCSTTTPIPTSTAAAAAKVNDFLKINEKFDSSIAISTTSEYSVKKLNDNIETPQHNTEPNKDELAIEHNKCDIDTKSDTNCNEIKENPLSVMHTSDSTTTPATIKVSRTHMSSMNLNKKINPRNLLNKELEEWIWEDNRYFLQDRNIFEHTYFK